MTDELNIADKLIAQGGEVTVGPVSVPVAAVVAVSETAVDAVLAEKDKLIAELRAAIAELTAAVEASEPVVLVSHLKATLAKHEHDIIGRASLLWSELVAMVSPKKVL